MERYTKIRKSEIEAYAIKDEILTRVQEINVPEVSWDYVKKIPRTVPDVVVGVAMPNARYSTRYELPVQTDESWLPFKDSLADHGMDKVLDALNSQFSETLKVGLF